MRMLISLPAEDLRGQDIAVGQVDGAVLGHDAVGFDRGAGFGGLQRGWSCGPGPGGGQGGQSGCGQVEADGLDPGPADAQVDHLGAGPERDHHPGPVRAEPELPARDVHVPAGRDGPLELHRQAERISAWFVGMHKDSDGENSRRDAWLPPELRGRAADVELLNNSEDPVTDVLVFLSRVSYKVRRFMLYRDDRAARALTVARYW